jgi:hypothetical protein
VTHLAHSLKNTPSRSEGEELPGAGGEIDFSEQNARKSLNPSDDITTTYDPNGALPLTIGNLDAESDIVTNADIPPAHIENDIQEPPAENPPTEGHPSSMSAPYTLTKASAKHLSSKRCASASRSELPELHAST